MGTAFVIFSVSIQITCTNMKQMHTTRLATGKNVFVVKVKKKNIINLYLSAMKEHNIITNVKRTVVATMF